MEMPGNRVSGESEDIKKKKMMEMFIEKIRRWPAAAYKNVWKVGRDDPRRVIHALKVGVSLTLVSSLYLVEPLFEGIGQNAIWAVMTVVVVLEFTAGATLCKGLNRGLGTLCAGSLVFFIEFIADESGKVFRAIFIGAAVFFIGSAATYMRFFPYIKKNYDYGVVIFLLTFNLIAVSSFRVHNVFRIAHERFYTIAIGCAVCLLMSLLIFPNWSGEELHNSTVSKLEGLAESIEACVKEYFKDSEIIIIQEEDKSSDEDPIYKGYKAVLDSKSIDETLALHASWEPRHSRHCHRYPWQQYVKLGAVLRHFGYTAVALHGCLQSEIQTPRSVRALFKDPCLRVAGEISKIFMELADSVRNRRHCAPILLSDHLQEALQDLNNAIKSQPRLFLSSNHSHATMLAIAAATATANQKSFKDSGVSLSSVKTDSSALLEWKTKRVADERKVLRPTLSKLDITSLEFSEALPFAAFASLLVEMAARLDMVIEQVEELGRLAKFKEYRADDREGWVLMAACVSNSMFLRWNKNPSSFFDWNKWKRSDDERPKPKYHQHIDLPFSPSLLNKTFLQGKELKCCYIASIDGFSATSFHNCCDFKGPCVVIGYTKNSFKFGAFNPEGYRSTDDYYDTFDAFLFYWRDVNEIEPVILPKVGGSGAALFDYARGGPQFGADGLLIGPPLAPVMGGFAGPDTNSGVGDLRQAKSRLGLSYAKREDGKESLFGDEPRTTLEEVQVFCNPKIASLY
ncbi:TLDc [Macleaya cordata]|uniref:TLDc n=1 Tax=Macleaya cordata TaxID=56857 RepID=A0A200PSW4_MACCD|nr:TLDc [Macleaya cordata]